MAPQFYKITRQSDGREARVYLRRNIHFFPDVANPSIRLIISRSLEEEIRDFQWHVDIYIARIPAGTHFLLPERYRDHLTNEKILTEADGWILARKGPQDQADRDVDL